jgi:hypothetical protein
MRIDSSGRVGIGDISPDAPLVVRGTASVPHTIFKVNSNSESTKFSVQTVQDSDIRIGTQSNHPLGLYTNQLERMRIDSSGRLLIGTTTQFGDGNDRLMIENTTNGGRIAFGTSATFSECIIGQVSAYWADNKKVAAISFFGGSDTTNKDDGTIRFATSSENNLTERMRINSSGKVGIGTTIQDHLLHVKGSSAVLKIDHTSTGDTKGVVMRHARGGLSGFTGKMISFIGNDNTEEGSIVIGTTATAFNTSSDYRLKENEVAISDGITRLKQLKPYIFNFKKDPDTTVDGFFAHEVQSVVPEAITGTKDEVDSDNNPVYQGIDQSKLVPLLVAALQEEISKRESLETRVAALEAA